MLNWKTVQSDPVLLKGFLKEYRDVTGKKICDLPKCSGKWEGMYNELLRLKEKGVTPMSERIYRLKKGKGFWTDNGRTYYTDANMTDDIARNLLQNRPSYAKYFINPPMPEAMPPGRQAAFQEHVKEQAPEPEKKVSANSTKPAPETNRMETEDTPAPPIKETQKQSPPIKPVSKSSKQPAKPVKKGK